MRLGNTIYSISISRDGTVWSNLSGTWMLETDYTKIARLRIVRKMFRSKKTPESTKTYVLNEYLNDFCNANVTSLTENIEETTTENVSNIDKTDITQKFDENEIIVALDKLINFFSEFEFEPNFRFVNTFARAQSKNEKIEYVKNYFELTNSPYASSIVEKMKSEEFDQICCRMSKFKTEKIVNKRFKLYYGSAGTGKTTRAMTESDGICMVCHSAMLPNDLMEDFKFEDGKATFVASSLQKAMINGTTIVLDEINLLPFESLRFLQTILDGKTQIEYKGHTIVIKDGFEIIGTMNLQVNGVTYALPEPLVDRAAELKIFKLTGYDLIGAIV